MLSIFATHAEAAAAKPVALHAVLPKGLEKFLAEREPAEARWLKTVRFAAKDGELVLVPDGSGGLAAAVLGLGAGRDPHALGLFSERLPPGLYTLGDVPSGFAGARAAYAWAIGTYAFERYRKQKKPKRKEQPRLVLPADVDGEAVSRIAEGVFLGRDLINTPSNDMGPAELEQAACSLAEKFGARLTVITGDALLGANYPMIHAVGRASVREPRLIDLVWGEDRHPKVTLVGKGVCFDTGGLDLKNASGMATMKKDMGGAACVLGLAQIIMDAKLPVRLRVMVPAVENSVSGSAYRPGDVLPSRKGLFVEIGNTDAEGRLVLADALADADTEKPDLMFCLATLTGAARAATGMELPPFFTDDERLAADLMRHGMEENDPVWRLPLWRSYEPAVDSQIADINNAPDYPLAGAITAALFLNRFIAQTESWAHFDIPAWIDRPKPGRRKGAEANAIRAMFAVIQARYRDR
ncbi:MAG TPA: leucyl aminopeptidase family protein [Micropepsaceae bacterium]|nr:leucyl aminopeptidase family protein [Micropepsaceae bacterium]